MFLVSQWLGLVLEFEFDTQDVINFFLAGAVSNAVVLFVVTYILSFDTQVSTRTNR